MENKLSSVSSLVRKLARRRHGGKIVFTNGCFDILHVGHVDYLQKAKKLGDTLVVGLNSDASVRRLKGKGRPVNKQADRARVLSGLSCVDHVVIFNEDTPYELIKALRPDTLVKGGDWKTRDIVGSDLVRSFGGKVARIAFVKGYSTTALIKKIGAG
jgi:rfaE bifunctional protein nucleotidyltransferase chain/domain